MDSTTRSRELEFILGQSGQETGKFWLEPGSMWARSGHSIHTCVDYKEPVQLVEKKTGKKRADLGQKRAEYGREMVGERPHG